MDAYTELKEPAPRYECRLAILGLPRAVLSDDSSGVGKSSLCSRFVRPSVSEDEWRDVGYDHSHVLTAQQFSRSEINQQHYVYHGVGVRSYERHLPYPPPKGSKAIELEIHVVEHTTFVNAEDGLAFSGGQHYGQRATQTDLKSPGKVMYTCLKDLSNDGSQNDQPSPCQLPKDFRRSIAKTKSGVNGFIFVLDPTAPVEERYYQWVALEKCWEYMSRDKKDKCAICLTKCDIFAPELRNGKPCPNFNVVEHFNMDRSSYGKKAQRSLEFRDCVGKMEVMCGKRLIPVFVTSSEKGIGIDAPFLNLAHRVLNLDGHPVISLPWPLCWFAITHPRQPISSNDTSISSDRDTSKRSRSQSSSNTLDTCPCHRHSSDPDQPSSLASEKSSAACAKNGVRSQSTSCASSTRERVSSKSSTSSKTSHTKSRILGWCSSAGRGRVATLASTASLNSLKTNDADGTSGTLNAHGGTKTGYSNGVSRSDVDGVTSSSPGVSSSANSNTSSNGKSGEGKGEDWTTTPPVLGFYNTDALVDMFGLEDSPDIRLVESSD